MPRRTVESGTRNFAATYGLNAAIRSCVRRDHRDNPIITVSAQPREAVGSASAVWSVGVVRWCANQGALLDAGYGDIGFDVATASPGGPVRRLVLLSCGVLSGDRLALFGTIKRYAGALGA